MFKTRDQASTTRWPNLFLVGAPRCGTSSMWRMLRAHNGVFAAYKKELHYFSADVSGRPGVASEVEYLQLFEGWEDETWAIDASVGYLYSDAAARRIKEV